MAEQRSQKIRVLIADDSQVVRDGLTSILQAHPDLLVVGEAVDGEEATRKVQDLHPDLVLMDVEMPGASGLEATRRIKACCQDTSVLFLAVHRSFLDAALDAGADGYLLKDAPRNELLDAIRRLYRRHGGQAVGRATATV